MKRTSSRLPLGVLFIVLSLFPAFGAIELVESVWKVLALYLLFKLAEMLFDLGLYIAFDGGKHDSV